MVKWYTTRKWTESTRASVQEIQPILSVRHRAFKHHFQMAYPGRKKHDKSSWESRITLKLQKVTLYREGYKIIKLLLSFVTLTLLSCLSPISPFSPDPGMLEVISTSYRSHEKYGLQLRFKSEALGNKWLSIVDLLKRQSTHLFKNQFCCQSCLIFKDYILGLLLKCNWVE